MKKKLLWFGALFVAVILIGTFVYFKFYYQQEKVKPFRGSVVESIYGLGTVSADETYNVRLGIAATIGQLYVKEGDRVEQNDKLVRVDGNIMRSKIKGTITKVSFKEDELVAPQVTILTVTNLKKLYLEVNLEQQSILRVKSGQEVYVSFETLRGEKYIGKVITIYPRENQFIVRIELEKWPEGVLPGMTADVAIIVGKKENTLLIPIISISTGQVTRIRNGKKEKITIKLGVIDGERAEVISDNLLETDELIIRKKR